MEGSIKRRGREKQGSFPQSLIPTLQLPTRNLILLIIPILLLTLPGWLPLLLDPGLVNTRAGGDSPFLLQRVHQMRAALRGGHFPARWMPDAAFGLGYPFWNYYAPLAFYVAAGFHLIGLSIVNAIKLTQILGFLLAAAGMYALADDIFDSRPVAILAAAAYTYAPFHLVNVYVRGDSLGEFVAFAFYPLIFLGLRRLRSQPAPASAAFTAVAYAGLVLAHNISALIFTPFALTYALLLLFARREREEQTREASPTRRNTQDVRRITHHAPRTRYLLWSAIALSLGLTLSAWYWAPALLEQDAVQLEGNLTGYFHYAGHFRSTDLIQSSPLFNFDVDGAGTPFAMSLAQAIIGLIALLTLTATVAFQSRKFTIHNSQFTIHNLFFAGTALTATFLVTPLSRPLWDHVPLLPFVQFPWRWLSVQAFGLSLVIASLARRPFRKIEHATRNTQYAVAITFALLLIITTIPSLDVEYLPVRDDDITAERLMLYEMFTGNIGSTVRAEYLPAAVVPRPWTSSYLTQGEVPTPIGADSARLLRRRPASQQWQVIVGQPGDVVFPTYWFPGWRATIDGQPAEASTQPNHGGIRIAMPAGTHRVELTLGRTRTRLLAEIASTIGLLLLLALLIRNGLSTHAVRAGAAAVVVVIVVAFTLIGVSQRGRGEASRRAGISADEPSTQLTSPALTMDFSHMPFLHPNPSGVEFAGGARLLGYRLSHTEVEAGQALDVALTWDRPSSNTGLTDGTEASNSDARPTSASSLSMFQAPTVELALVSPAEVLFQVPAMISEARAEIEEHVTLRLRVPVDTTAGLYLPRLRLMEGERVLPAKTAHGRDLGTLYLEPIRIRPSSTSPGQMVGRFADVAGLGPVETEPASPKRLEVQMTWWPERAIAANYATSVRLKDAAGETLAQRDIQPCYGFCPTSSWEAGVPVYDRRWLDMPADTRLNGPHQLEVVLYERASLAAIDTVQVDVDLPSD